MIRRFAPHDCVAVTAYPARRLAARMPELARFVYASAPEAPAALSRHPAWLGVLAKAFGHEVFALEATIAGELCGFLPLAHVESALFGKHLVSLPYLNSNGVVAKSPDVAARLVDRAEQLRDEVGAAQLELRHESPLDHPALTGSLTSKVHSRLTLPTGLGATDVLWKGFDPKVRNQIRKGEKPGFGLRVGGAELLEAFYEVLCVNMRDLGTPVYGRGLFEAILTAFPQGAELVVAFDGAKPIAAGLLLHGPGVTEVPTASSLRGYNASCVNMLLYHKMLLRAVERGQAVFDFGRSTIDGPTLKFKRQWGAETSPAVWQYSTAGREATETEGERVRPDNPKFARLIRLWQRLPVAVASRVGPWVVRGIP